MKQMKPQPQPLLLKRCEVLRFLKTPDTNSVMYKASVPHRRGHSIDCP